jgi:two-component system OmpR family sensor kinase
MAGFETRLKESIQFRLSFFLSLAILVVAIVAGIFSFVSAFDEAYELQDDVLRQVGALFDRQHLPLAHLGDDGRVKDSDEESRVIVQYLQANDRISTRKADGGTALPLPFTLSDGLHTLEIGGESFRVLVKSMANGEKIALAQETGVRDKIARDSALRTVMPFLILMPVLLLVVADLVRKMFQPIAALAADLDRRAGQELHPVEEGRVPIEVRAFVAAINRLLERVALSMDSQRRFVADAAHELRTPLTALSLQAERLGEAGMSAVARERLTVLRGGIQRGRHLLDQLLTLASVHAGPTLPTAPVSVQSIYRRILEDVHPLTEAKHIDIGVVGDGDAQILVSEIDLIMLVKNLVDNAIRYTSEGGRIDLAVDLVDRHAVLEIKDSGPGIPPEERVLVFDPFYRILGSDQVGSGLGLSIVKAIADRIGADVHLAFSDEVKQAGLCVTVRIPAADASARPGSCFASAELAV